MCSMRQSWLNPYEQLELETGAPWEQVQSAYRRLAKEHHPDRGGDADQFRAIKDAYEQLKKLGRPIFDRDRIYLD